MFAYVSQTPYEFPPFLSPTSESVLPPLVEHAREVKRAYGQGYEANVVRKGLNGFDFQSSPAWRAVTDHFGTNTRLRELKGIVFALIAHIENQSKITLPALSRNEKRNLPLLVKYIDSHFSVLVPLFRCVTLCDENQEVIPFLDATVRQDSEHSES
jgi:hypothetical protein